NPSLGDGPGTRYVYDEMDEQVLRIDALGNVWATLRDAAENVVKEIHPNTYDFQTNDGEGIRSEYDSNDNKIRIIYLTRVSSVSSTTPWAISSRKSNPWITMPNGTMARAIPTNTMK